MCVVPSGHIHNDGYVPTGEFALSNILSVVDLIVPFSCSGARSTKMDCRHSAMVPINGNCRFVSLLTKQHPSLHTRYKSSAKPK